MEFSDRQAEILTRIRMDGRVEVDGLSAEYGVTTRTIRRDRNQLRPRGLAAGIHGAACEANGVENLIADPADPHAQARDAG